MTESKYTFSFPPSRGQKVSRSHIKSKIGYKSNNGIRMNDCTKLVLQKERNGVYNQSISKMSV